MTKRSKSKNASKKSKRAKNGDYLQVSVPRPSITPNSIVVTLPYYFDGGATSAIIGYGYQQFRMNSIFDVDLTGAGHQPMGHDQWANLYMRYRVVESDITATVNANGATYADNYEYCLNITETATAATTIVDAIEQPYSAWGMSTYYGNASEKLYKKVNCAKMEGTRAVKYEQDYSAAFGASPVQVFYANLYYNNTANSRYAVFMQAKMNFKVILYDRADLLTS